MSPMKTPSVQERTENQLAALDSQRKLIRELSPLYLFGKPEASTASVPKRPMESVGPSTLTELSEALRDPLPKPEPKSYSSALDAFAAWEPLTLEMVSDRLTKQKEARDAIIAEYIERTGQQVDYCDECDMGVVEEENEEGLYTVVTPATCEACDGLGVIQI